MITKDLLQILNKADFATINDLKAIIEPHGFSISDVTVDGDTILHVLAKSRHAASLLESGIFYALSYLDGVNSLSKNNLGNSFLAELYNNLGDELDNYTQQLELLSDELLPYMGNDVWLPPLDIREADVVAVDLVEEFNNKSIGWGDSQEESYDLLEATRARDPQMVAKCIEHLNGNMNFAIAIQESINEVLSSNWGNIYSIDDEGVLLTLASTGVRVDMDRLLKYVVNQQNDMSTLFNLFTSINNSFEEKIRLFEGILRSKEVFDTNKASLVEYIMDVAPSDFNLTHLLKQAVDYIGELDLEGLNYSSRSRASIDWDQIRHYESDANDIRYVVDTSHQRHKDFSFGKGMSMHEIEESIQDLEEELRNNLPKYIRKPQ